MHAHHIKVMPPSTLNAARILTHVFAHAPSIGRRQCQEYSECSSYAPAQAANKPVFNIEYNAAAFQAACANQASYSITTILKASVKQQAGGQAHAVTCCSAVCLKMGVECMSQLDFPCRS